MRDTKNVLFIIIDQLRADCLHGALAHHVDLPNMRAFMQEAVSFRRHFSVTNPCGPSRASILTGQYAMNHRSVRNGTPLRHDIPNIATEMRKAGYLPMLFGYTDTSQDPRVFDANDPAVKTYEFPLPGFHEMTEMRFEMSYPWQGHLMSQGYEFDDYLDLYKPVAQKGCAAQIDDPAIYAAEDSDTAFLTNNFLGKINAHHKENWFAHLTYIRPHPPLVAPAPYNKMYDPQALPLPERCDTAEEEHALHPYMQALLNSTTTADFVEGFPDLKADDDTVQKLRAIYLGLATEVDLHIGRVITFLKESGQYDNTMVVLTADHGEMLGDRHAWGKMSFFDVAYHTPLIIRAPGMAAPGGTAVDLPTESVDVTPTILDWVGQKVPNSMDGRSLMPFLQGETPEDWRDYSYSELDFAALTNPTEWQRQFGTSAGNSNLCILRDQRFTLVQFATELPPVLFDSEAKGEFENVADKPEYSADLMRMMSKLLRHRMQNMDHTLSLSTITPQGPKEFPRH